MKKKKPGGKVYLPRRDKELKDAVKRVKQRLKYFEVAKGKTMEKTESVMIPFNTDAASDLEKLRDRRIAPGACCKNCRFGYPYRVDLINSLLECRQGPAQYPIAMALDANGNIIQSKIGAPVPRIVPETYFCGSWQPDLQ